MARKEFIDHLNEFFNKVTNHLKDELEQLEKEYDKTKGRLEKVLKQSDNQQKQLITLHKKLKDAYVELDEYRMNLEEKVNQKVKELLEAKHDSLTKLPNRGMFHEILPKRLEEASSKQQIVALMFIDLDKFKNINDTLGHDAGDEILIKASHRIEDIIKHQGTLFRLGGDEFTVIFSNVENKQEIKNIANEIVNQMKIDFELSAGIGQIGASIGISIFPEDGNSKEELLKNSDEAMYKAKKNGRGQYQFFRDFSC
jgi:diguanylate cyclase (GGDEF)-like protein